MKKLLLFLITIALFSCKENNQPEPLLLHTLEEVKTIASKYGLSDMVTFETNGGLRYYNDEQLEEYFTRHKRYRAEYTMDSTFHANIYSVKSYPDYEKLIDAIPGMRERDRVAFGNDSEYKIYRENMQKVGWHIYYEPNTDPVRKFGTIKWVNPEDDNGTTKGIRLDKATR